MSHFSSRALLGFFIFLCVASAHGHNKVVVIPLGGDEAPTSKVIFRTNDAFQGNLGGISGADEKCQTAADNAGVKGIFKAWVGGVTAAIGLNPARPDFTYYDLPYRNVDGTSVAGEFVDFFDDQFNARIKSETSVDNNVIVWTGLSDAGERRNNCAEWMSINQGASGTYGGNEGGIEETRSWSEDGVSTCNVAYSIYCFEQ